ncbi:MAG: ABC transporter ATP-binding protein [Planctomycetaceae bacterium]|nr:ABC transporter ATP-binding protein [Planctomycetaceae bacterium]
MTKPIISVENLSKAYRLGLKEEVPDTFVSAMAGVAKAPLKNFRRLRQLDTSGHDGSDDDILWALKDVNFEVNEGEVVGIIGRNGAGKSTLLKVLSRITEPTSGCVKLRGRVSSLLEVGTGFHPELSGRDNIYMNGTILGMTKKEIDRKFDEIVDFSGVEKFLDTPVKRYSSGMQVRLAFAVAAHLEPEILIVDEVLAVGDAEFQKKCLGKMQDVSHSGRTVLFVSHNMAAVESLCSRAIHISNGAVLGDGDTSKQVAKYLNVSRLENGKPLVERKDRTGTSDALMTNIRFLDYINSPIKSISIGDSLSIELNYTLRDVSYRVTKVALSCFSSDGKKIFHIDSEMSERSSFLKSSSGSIRCKIPRFPLPSGEYSFDVMLMVNGAVADHIHNATSLEVLPGDFYGCGKHANSHDGIFFLDHEWLE